MYRKTPLRVIWQQQSLSGKYNFLYLIGKQLFRNSETWIRSEILKNRQVKFWPILSLSFPYFPLRKVKSFMCILRRIFIKLSKRFTYLNLALLYSVISILAELQANIKGWNIHVWTPKFHYEVPNPYRRKKISRCVEGTSSINCSLPLSRVIIKSLINSPDMGNVQGIWTIGSRMKIVD